MWWFKRNAVVIVLFCILCGIGMKIYFDNSRIKPAPEVIHNRQNITQLK